jgi:hypothetical protein
MVMTAVFANQFTVRQPSSGGADRPAPTGGGELFGIPAGLNSGAGVVAATVLPPHPPVGDLENEPETWMSRFLRIAVVSASLAVTTLMSGCIVVPPGRHCGHYHCW